MRILKRSEIKELKELVESYGGELPDLVYLEDKNRLIVCNKNVINFLAENKIKFFDLGLEIGDYKNKVLNIEGCQLIKPQKIKEVSFEEVKDFMGGKKLNFKDKIILSYKGNVLGMIFRKKGYFEKMRILKKYKFNY